VWVNTGRAERTPRHISGSVSEQHHAAVAADFRVDCSGLKNQFNLDDLSNEQDYYHILIDYSNA
jgi:hypothetical protein